MRKSQPPTESKQPASASTDGFAVGQQPVLYRSPLHLELQKFGDHQRDQEFHRLENTGSPDVEVTGLALSHMEDQVLCGLVQALAGTGFEGNLRSKDHPRLRLTYAEFFEACGLPDRRDGHHRQEALLVEALHRLADVRRCVCYTLRYQKATKYLSEVHRWRGPLILLEEIDVARDLEETEARRVQEGADLPGRQGGFIITFSSLFTEQISSFHVLKPTTLHQEIKQLSGGRRVPRSTSAFIELLLTVDHSPFKIGHAKLIEKLRLDDLYDRQRQKSYVQRLLTEAIEVAQQLQYITSWHQAADGLYTFNLNEVRCTRIAAKQKRSLPPAKD